ncbi:MAG TPA: lytic transglycosylase domain-containing protein [Candidatus Sulfopaludibacter sp.]|jgi:soluble lytic murein transglycosylase-like protein|nr:lytic transglycosylase domain-containing protein [Candidatus Sulfopaludibacter sp.]
MRLLVILSLLSSSCLASEYAVLASGSRLRVDRHEAVGQTVKLYNGEGYIEMDAAQVRSFEPDDRVAPAPAPPVAPVEMTEVADGGPIVLSPIELADVAADRYGLPHWLVREVMHVESGFQANAVSPKGAIGLMQLMPGTAQVLGVNPKDPAQNADAGARYLRELLDKYDGRLWHALAAYNAGPGAVEKYRGVPPYRETIDYINRIDKERKKNTK